MLAPLSIPSPDWNEFVVGPIVFRMYAICILVAIVAATAWTSRRLTRRGAQPGVILDIVLWGVPLGIVGARLYHVITHPGDYFYPGADLWEIVRIWNGGNAIFGALIGGAIGMWIGCRMSGMRFWAVADAAAPALLLAQAIGRLGNWFNQELFGYPTTLPWGLEIDSDNPGFPVGLPTDTLFQPTFLYEILWNLVGIAAILWLERVFTLHWGRAFGIYLIWYGLGRTWLESIRIDASEVFFGVRVNLWAALIAIAVGVVLIAVQGRRHPGLEPSPYSPGREPQHKDPEVGSDDAESQATDPASAPDDNGETHEVATDPGAKA